MVLSVLSSKGMSQACLIKIVLFSTKREGFGFTLCRTGGLLFQTPLKEEEPEVERSLVGIFTSKQSWMLFHVRVFLGCGNWLFWVFCLFSMRQKHIAHFIDIKQTRPDGYSS